MKAAISKEQNLELRKWLEKHRVPKETIESLLNSRSAGNTYKAYRLKKQIVTPDGWAINFGANWARQLEYSDTSTKPADSSAPAAENGAAKKEETVDGEAQPDSKDIKTIGEDFLSRTFMGLAEKLKKLQVEDVDKPQMQKIALEIDKDHLAMLKKYAEHKEVTVGSLIRQAIRKMLEEI